MLFDTHAHYDDPCYDEDRDEVITAAYNSGVSLIINASSDIDAGKKGISIAEQYPFMYASIGVHPHYAKEFGKYEEEAICEKASHPKVVAIGETGLDYYYDNSPAEPQKACFAAQINIARKMKLPLIIHSRDATSDTIDIVKAENARDVGGVFHCYGYSLETARILLDMGFYFSFGGILTFKKAHRVREIAAWLPADRILIETDSPYIAPEPYRGKRNDSSYIRYVAAALSACRNISEEEAARITYENGRRLFRISQI